MNLKFLPSFLLILLTPFPVPAAEEPARPGSLRALTYNIHHGRGMDGKVDLDRIARVIAGAKPDLVALQEVDRGAE